MKKLSHRIRLEDEKEEYIMKKSKLLAAVLCATVLFITGCGDGTSGGGKADSGVKDTLASTAGKNGDDANSGTGKSSGTDTGSSSGKNAGGDSLNLYLVGDDIVAVSLKSDLCKELLPKGEYEESDNELLISSAYDENGYSMFQMTMKTFYPYIYYYETSGGEGQHVSGRYDSVSDATKDGYFGLIYEKGLVNKLKLDGPFTLFLFSNGEGTEVAQFDAANVVKKVSLEELIEVGAETLNVEKPIGNYAGVYISDAYSSEHTANAEIKVTEHGGIYFNGTVDGEKVEFIGFEEYHADEQQSDYNQSRVRALNITEQEMREISWYKSSYGDGDYSEGIGYNYDDYSGGNSSYLSVSLDRFTPKFATPADYQDEDRTGNLSVKDAEDSKYFKPESEDYILYASVGTTYYSYNIDYYQLQSFDVNGLLIDSKTKFKFTSESDASAFYNERVNDQWDESTYHLAGNIVYETRLKSNGMHSAGKREFLVQTGARVYKNANYLYGWYDEEYGKYASEIYISKPYTDEDLNMSLEDTVFWQGIPGSRGGYHPSVETKNNYLYTAIYDDDVDFSLYGDVFPSGTFTEMKFTGRSLIAVKLGYEWANGGDVYYLDFTEITFEEGKASVTQYRFPAGEDLFQYEAPVNFDNFRTKTPEKKTTQTYDLSREAQPW